MHAGELQPLMKTNVGDLSGLYLAALRTHLEQDSPTSMESARDMGRQALEIGLETLDLAKIHETALAAFVLPEYSLLRREDVSSRAAVFFTEAITPIEKTHLAARETEMQLQQVSQTLDRRTLDLADSNRELQAGITDRKTAEATLKSSKKSFGALLKESRLLEEHLQNMAHKIMSANEEERKFMSRQLQDEIAQTLLGIHVRLLTLKNEVELNNEGLTKEIAITQRLVEASVKTIKRLAAEFGIQHEN